MKEKILNNFGRKIIYLGLILITIAFSLIIRNRVIEIQAGQNSKEILEVMKESNNISLLDNTLDKKMNTVTIDGYEYIGTLIIPEINLELPVLADYKQNTLKIAPNRYSGSIYTNDLVICAHYYKTHFKEINKLKKEDKIIFKDVNNDIYLYEVVKSEILSPTDIEKMIDSEFDLTLYTCTTDRKNRVTIRANKININEKELKY